MRLRAASIANGVITMPCAVVVGLPTESRVTRVTKSRNCNYVTCEMSVCVCVLCVCMCVCVRVCVSVCVCVCVFASFVRFGATCYLLPAYAATLLVVCSTTSTPSTAACAPCTTTTLGDASVCQSQCQCQCQPTTDKYIHSIYQVLCMRLDVHDRECTSQASPSAASVYLFA